MNLIENYPRSPRETLNGLVHVPRMIDKANAFRNGELGEYIFPCPVDKIMLEFLGLSHEEFVNKIYDTDKEEVSKWLSKIINSKNTNDIDCINERILDPKRVWWKKVYGLIFNKLNPSENNFKTWVDRVDYEEGRSFKEINSNKSNKI